MVTRKRFAGILDLGVTGFIRVVLHLRLLFSGNLVQPFRPRTFYLSLYPYAIIPVDRPSRF